MAEFQIYPVTLPTGNIAISPIPGLSGDFEADLAVILTWQPALVLSLTTNSEIRQYKATDLPVRLYEAGIDWLHLPIEDFGEPTGETADFWPTAAAKAHEVLDRNRKVLIHCRGGQGRSGMVALRLMVERGKIQAQALAQMRQSRPGAVETDAQLSWASRASVSYTQPTPKPESFGVR